MDEQSLKLQFIEAEVGKLKVLKLAHEKETKKLVELKEKRRLEEQASREKQKLENFMKEKEKEKKEEEAESAYANSLLSKAQKSSTGDLEPLVNVMKHNKSKHDKKSFKAR